MSIDEQKAIRELADRVNQLSGYVMALCAFAASHPQASEVAADQARKLLDGLKFKPNQIVPEVGGLTDAFGQASLVLDLLEDRARKVAQGETKE